MVDENLIAAWEEAYRRYGNAMAEDVAIASRAVAAAWRDLAVGTELPWWLLAAVHTSAEAFDLRAEAWEAASDQSDPTGTAVVEDDDTDTPDQRQHSWPAAVLPTARRPTNGWRVLADTGPGGNNGC